MAIPSRCTAGTATEAVTKRDEAHVLFGYAIYATEESLIKIFDGKSGKLLSVEHFPAKGSSHNYHGGEGIEVRTGEIYLEIVSGKAEWAVYWV
jgi:hypothetical protein